MWLFYLRITEHTEPLNLYSLIYFFTLGRIKGNEEDQGDEEKRLFSAFAYPTTCPLPLLPLLPMKHFPVSCIKLLDVDLLNNFLLSIFIDGKPRLIIKTRRFAIKQSSI